MANRKTGYQLIFSLLVILMCSCTPKIETDVQRSNWVNNQQVGGFDKVLIYAPPAKSEKKNSLLVLLHGCIQKNTDLQKANIETSAEKYNFVVAIPQSKHPQGHGCWAYWQGMGSRNTEKTDYRNLISLAEELVADPDLRIDADNLIIAGMSSGATFAGQTACLAPDIFSGVVMMAGPSIGTSAAGAIKTCEPVNPNQFASRCKTSAGIRAEHLQSQRALIAMGEKDTTVHACYNEQNALGFAKTYGLSKPVQSETLVTREYSGSLVTETNWDSDRLRMISLPGVDHSWPGGTGSSGAYVSSNSISLIEYLMDFMDTKPDAIQENK